MASKAIKVADRGNGTYTVEYCVPLEGTYTVNATLHGNHIQGSPMGLSVFRCGTQPSALGLGLGF